MIPLIFGSISILLSPQSDVAPPVNQEPSRSIQITLPATSNSVHLRVSTKTEKPYQVYVVRSELSEQPTVGLNKGSSRTLPYHSEKSLRDYFRQAPDSPGPDTSLLFRVDKGASIENVFAALDVVRVAGYEKVWYYGCIPQGKSIRAGESPEQQNFQGRVFDTKALHKILSDNLAKS